MDTVLKSIEELRRETEASKQKTARIVHPWHVLGYESPVEYDREAFRSALKAHLKAVMEEDLSVDELTGKFLFEETDNIVLQLSHEYTWFRFLREKIGVAVTEPAEIRTASLLAPKSVKDVRWERYRDSFHSWLDKLIKAHSQREAYFAAGIQGVLMVQPAMLVTPLSKHPQFSIRFLLIPEKVELEPVVGSNIINVSEQAHNRLPVLVDYARNGYAILLSLPVVLTPNGNEGVIYWPEEQRMYYFDPVDDDDEEVA